MIVAVPRDENSIPELQDSDVRADGICLVFARVS